MTHSTTVKQIKLIKLNVNKIISGLNEWYNIKESHNSLKSDLNMQGSLGCRELFFIVKTLLHNTVPRRIHSWNMLDGAKQRVCLKLDLN